MCNKQIYGDEMWRRLDPSVLWGHEQNTLMRETEAGSGKMTDRHCSHTDVSKRPSPEF